MNSLQYSGQFVTVVTVLRAGLGVITWLRGFL